MALGGGPPGAAPAVRRAVFGAPGFEAAIAWAAGLLAAGWVVAYPTETFYALGARCDLAEAVGRVYALKGRGAEKALPVIAGSPEAARLLAREWPEAAEILAALFWPGPLTLVLRASGRVCRRLTAETGTLAIRVSPHPVARALAQAAGGCVVSTSANPSGGAPARRVEDIAPGVLAGLSGALDGGETPGGFPSTIVDVTVTPPRIVRPGAVSEDDLRRALGESPAKVSRTP